MTEKISAELLAHWEGEIVDSRVVPGQGLCAVRRFILTDGLMTHVQIDYTECDYEARYCYENRRAALDALRTWDGNGDPPGPWIKEKTSERLGPGARVTAEERARHERIRIARTCRHERSVPDERGHGVRRCADCGSAFRRVGESTV